MAAAGEAVFPKRRRLVRVDDPVKLQAIRLLAVLGELRELLITAYMLANRIAAAGSTNPTPVAPTSRHMKLSKDHGVVTSILG